jgi:hypothetical protein
MKQVHDCAIPFPASVDGDQSRRKLFLMNSSAGDRVEIPPDAFVRVTGQMWKLVLGGLVLPWPAIVIGVWFFRQLGSVEAIETLRPAIAAMALIAAAILFLFGSVKCPQCSTRLVVRVFKDPDGLNALTGLLNMRACPQCGHVPQTAVSTR